MPIPFYEEPIAHTLIESHLPRDTNLAASHTKPSKFARRQKIIQACSKITRSPVQDKALIRKAQGAMIERFEPAQWAKSCKSDEIWDRLYRALEE